MKSKEKKKSRKRKVVRPLRKRRVKEDNNEEG
jgi:hypothetical protein